MDKSKDCLSLVCGCYRAEHKHVPPCSEACFQKDLEISAYANWKGVRKGTDYKEIWNGEHVEQISK